MGRRSDHTREELTALFVDVGARQLAERGLARFSARDVAKQAGYSVGSIYNVFGSYDGLILAINARTLRAWTALMRARLAAAGGGDRIGALVGGYFEFAAGEPQAWIAIFEHRMADGGPAPDDYQAVVGALMALVTEEIAAALPGAAPQAVSSLARSLAATVHGHCLFSLFRTFDMLGEAAPVEAALSRVREAIAAAGRTAD
jgi:AcrR family transcriptional regulator